MNRATSKMEWIEEQHHQEKAAKTADELIARLKVKPPIDPLTVAETERDILKFAGGDLGSRYDGKLEYVRSKGLFLLYYNTKYDAGLPDGEHHPRTLFSLSHELGHFFIDHHHQCLRRGVKPHRSQNEFRSHRQIEREADAFAASLMMPTSFARPLVNQSPLSMDRIKKIAKSFGASLVSAAIRSVRLSDFPCALAGIRHGRVAWMFPSDPLINVGIYPRRRSVPENAKGPWDDMTNGTADQSEGDGSVADWFDTFGREDFDEVFVGEEYVPVPVTETLMVLLTIDEGDIAGEDDSD